MNRTTTRAALRPGDVPVLEDRGSSLVYRQRIFVPLWVTLLGQAWRAVWRGMVRIVRGIVRYPVQVAAAVTTLAVHHVAGRVGVLALVLLLLGSGLVWRYRWPGAFDRHVTVRARSWWRWRRVYRRCWYDLMDGCGLVETGVRGESLPQIARLRSSRDRDLVDLVLPYGQIPDDVTRSVDAIGHGLRAWRASVTGTRPGGVSLLVQWSDPLAEPISPDLPEATVTPIRTAVP